MERVCCSYDVIGLIKFLIASIDDHHYHLLPLAYVDNSFGPRGRVHRRVRAIQEVFQVDSNVERKRIVHPDSSADGRKAVVSFKLQ